MDDQFKPNAEDENGEYWDPWEALGIRCGGYNSAVDQNAIDILRAIGRRDYDSSVAAQTGLAAEYVELWQYIFCTANWCNYGTSPRACFPEDDRVFPKLIAAWEAYYLRQWGEPAQGTSASG